MNPSSSIPVVFIHGLWMHEGSWEKWTELFNAHGYTSLAPGWPGERRGIAEITRHVANIIRVLPGPPIVVGHCLGGLVAQKLLGMGLARGGVAIAPVQFHGIRRLSPTQIKTMWPLLEDESDRTDCIGFTRERFHEAFANGLSREESGDLYERYHIRSDAQPVQEVGRAYLSRRSPATVDTAICGVAAGRAGGEPGWWVAAHPGSGCIPLESYWNRPLAGDSPIVASP